MSEGGKARRILDSVPVLLLRSARVLVPRRLRREWFAEWRAELWQVSNSCSRQEATAFCLGAFHDALWLRRNTARTTTRRLELGSASRCGLSLGIWAAASLLLCFSLPGSRKVLPLPHDSDSLVMLSSDGFAGSQMPGIRLADYRSWKTSTRHLFSGLAFYQPLLKRVHIAPHRSAEMTIVLASDTLFSLLKMPSFPEGPAASQGSGRLILSETTWHKDFQSDPQMAGRSVEIAGQQFQIAGVISQDLWRLPGQADAWLLEDEQQLGTHSPNARGFIVGEMRASGFPASVSAPTDEWHYITVPRQEGGRERFDCIPLSEQTRQPFSFFLFTLFVACLALPATTPLPLGDYPSGGEQLPWRTRVRRWVFLAAKVALIVPSVYFTSLALAYGAHVGAPSANLFVSQYIQLATSFCGLLFAFRWALQDQRKRCPVCLRRLTNPAHVGESSRNFLAWNGTELICAGGHGLLHIPELPTSWFGTQRWLYLDASWSGLFSEPCLTSSSAV